MKKFMSQTALERKLFTKEEQKRIAYMRANAILLDPDGYDTISEIRAALGKASASETLGDAA